MGDAGRRSCGTLQVHVEATAVVPLGTEGWAVEAMRRGRVLAHSKGRAKLISREERKRGSQRSLQPELLKEGRASPPHAWFGRQTRVSSSQVERSLELPLRWGHDVGSRQGQGGLSPKTHRSGTESRKKEGGRWRPDTRRSGGAGTGSAGWVQRESFGRGRGARRPSSYPEACRWRKNKGESETSRDQGQVGWAPYGEEDDKAGARESRRGHVGDGAPPPTGLRVKAGGSCPLGVPSSWQSLRPVQSLPCLGSWEPQRCDSVPHRRAPAPHLGLPLGGTPEGGGLPPRNWPPGERGS